MLRAVSIRLLLVIGITGLDAAGQVSAIVDINAAQTTPLNAGFSGFNDEVVFPAEFFDYRLNNLAAQLSPGWVRYPSGSFSDAFNWQTGMMVPSWSAQFAGTNIATLLTEAVPWVNGKGGDRSSMAPITPISSARNSSSASTPIPTRRSRRV